MDKTLYLHIGANKTGSSAIQSYMAMNRERLRKVGLLYPVTGAIKGPHYGVSSHLGFAYGATDWTEAGTSVSLFQQLHEEIASSHARDVVISSESFVLPGPVEAVREFFAEYRVKVIVYLRRHDSWWPSAYNQALRTVSEPPWGSGFEAYMKYQERLGPCSSRGAYRLLLDRWAEVFGKDNIIVRPFEAGQNRANVVADFLCTIGYGALGDTLPAIMSRVNDSLDARTLALVEAIHKADLDVGTKHRMVEILLSQKGGRGNPFSVSPAIRLSLIQRYQDDYEYIAREYLGRSDGRLFYDPLPKDSIIRRYSVTSGKALFCALIAAFRSPGGAVKGGGDADLAS